MDFERVLVPIDFSKGSVEAFEATLAHFKNTHILLLHVIDSHQSDKIFEEEAKIEFQSKVQDAAYEKLEGLARRHPGSDCKIDTLVSVGRTASSILEVAKNHRIDLIVIGSHGNSSISKKLFGHTTYHVSRKAACSTWIIKGASTRGNMEQAA